MNDKEFIAALKDMDNDTLMDNLEDLGGDAYYQELRSAIIAEIRKRLADTEGEYVKKNDIEQGLIKEYKGKLSGHDSHLFVEFMAFIDDLPTYHFPERKGEWIINDDGTFTYKTYGCKRSKSDCDAETEEGKLIKTYVNLGLTEEQAKHIIEVSKKELEDDV